MAPVRLWQVIGGAGKGGIVVRTGEDVASSLELERLATGAEVKELELRNDRLHYERVSGTGPATGWASVVLKDGKPLMARRCEPPARDPSAVSPKRRLPPVAGRKMRVLALHGCPGNSAIMKFMCTQLKSMAGSDVEWVFLDGPCKWAAVPGSTRPNAMEPSDFAKRIAGKKPFVAWYSHPGEGDPSADKPPKMRKDTGDYVGLTTYGDVEAGIEYLDEALGREGPVDVLVAFSQSATLAAILIGALQRQGREVPWRLSVLFCGAEIDDVDHQLDEMSDQPTIYVHGGAADDWAAIGQKCLPMMYTDLLMLEHADGHVLPTTQPAAGEIYARVVGEMRGICGLPAEPPRGPAPKG